MTDIQERRRQKLLARGAQLSATGANPITKPAQPVEPTNSQLITETKPLIEAPAAEKAPSQSAPVKKAPSQKVEVDYKVLHRLTEDKQKFQTAKRINRVGFSFLLGVVFHYFYVAANVHYCTLGNFIPLLITFYYLME